MGIYVLTLKKALANRIKDNDLQQFFFRVEEKPIDKTVEELCFMKERQRAEHSRHSHDVQTNTLRTMCIIMAIICFSLDPLCFNEAIASSAAAFTERPTDARAFGMGSAISALSQYGSGSYWNPATLGFVKSSEINSMQSTILGDVHYLNFGYNRLSKDNQYGIAWAFNFTNVRVDGIQEAKYDNGSAWQTGNSFDYSGSVYVLSAAKTIDRKLSLGANLKHINEELFYNNAAGTGLDIGALYKLDRKWTMGLVYQNIIAPTLAWDTSSGTTEKMPSNLILGISYQVTRRLLLCTDINNRSDRGFGFSLGGEYRLNDYFSVRAGLDQDRLVLGTSIFYNQFGVHYAFAPEPVGQFTDQKHYLSISYALEGNAAPEVPEEEEVITPPLKKGEAEQFPTAAAGTVHFSTTLDASVTTDISEVVIEEESNILIKSMSVKRAGPIIKTNITMANDSDVTANVLTSLSIYDKDMQAIQVFSAKALSIEPYKEETAEFNWRYKTSLPYGEYYFKTRVAFDNKERTVLKKVVRR